MVMWQPPVETIKTLLLSAAFILSGAVAQYLKVWTLCRL